MGARTVMSVLHDVRGTGRDFALVIPLPEVPYPGQVSVGDRTVFDRLDAYSAPRIGQYLEDRSCDSASVVRRASEAGPRVTASPEPRYVSSRTLGVNVEASYAVGESDTVVLSSQYPENVETWLAEHGYRISLETARALRTYIRQGMKLFVARVNVGHISRTGLNYVRPLQIAYESDKFTLPLRVGMLNAEGPQDLVAYILTRKGRVEATNYRTVKLPAELDMPVYNRGEFASYYRTMFDRTAYAEGMRAVFTEYVWDAASCDPCTADPLSYDELRRAGAFWIDGYEDMPGRASVRGTIPPVASAMVTRLHVRYTPQTFPEDIMLRETSDRQPFQARYFTHRAGWVNSGWYGAYSCADVRYYEGARRPEVVYRPYPAEDVRVRDASVVSRQQWWSRLGN